MFLNFGKEINGLKKFWNKRAKEYDNYMSASAGYTKLINEIINTANPKDRDIGIDIGAGTGALTVPLSTMVQNLYAIDTSCEMLKILKAKLKRKNITNVETISADIRRMPLISTSVTLIVTNYCLHHLKDGERSHAIREFYRILKQNGRIVIGDVMFSQDEKKKIMRERLEEKKRKMKYINYLKMRILEILQFSRRYKNEYPIPSEMWITILHNACFKNLSYKRLKFGNSIVYGEK